jgi:hypothetical protein
LALSSFWLKWGLIRELRPFAAQIDSGPATIIKESCAFVTAFRLWLSVRLKKPLRPVGARVDERVFPRHHLCQEPRRCRPQGEAQVVMAEIRP